MLHSPVKTVCSCRPLPFSIPGREQSGANPPQSRINPGFFKTFRTLPQQHLFNEWYAKDTSKKVRAVLRNKGMSGQRLGGITPYGYIKGESGQLVLDEETAPVVRLIFQLCVEGNGTGKIARILSERAIPTPATVNFQRFGWTKGYHPDMPCLWTSESISSILAQDTYLGQTTNFKYSRPSFKSKRSVKNPAEKQMTFRTNKMR